MKQKKIRIVLADNHETVRQTWKLLLQSDNRFSISECNNEAELMEAISTMNIDLILMDTDMHLINGFHSTKEVLKQYPSIKIIGISVHDEPNHVRHLFKLGASGFVTKDVSKAEMINAILTVCGGGKFVSKAIREKMKQAGDKEFFQ
jgi:DNA-binding NarL/FixJ family response regulator